MPRPPPGSAYRGQVIIVPDKDLYLVPFSLLRAEGKPEYLYQQFHLLFAPSLQTLISKKGSRTARKKSGPSKIAQRVQKTQRNSEPSSLQTVTRIPRPKSPSRPVSPVDELISKSGEENQSVPTKPVHLVVGNPSIPISVSQCNWQPMVGAEKETKRVAELLEVKPIMGSQASKDLVLSKIPDAESIYFATNVSWSQSQFVLAAKEDIPNDGDIGCNNITHRVSGDGAPLLKRGVADGSAVESMPEPSQYLLSLSDLMDARTKAKIIVVSASHRPESPRITAESLMVMAEGLLASGADAVVLPLWPASYQGSRLMMNAFFSSLLYGSRASRALSYAMQV